MRAHGFAATVGITLAGIGVAAWVALVSEAAAAGDPVAGKRVFAQAGCGSCHTFRPAGATGKIGPALDGTTLTLDQVVARVTSGRGIMPAFSGTLSAQEIADVAAFVTGQPPPAAQPTPGTPPASGGPAAGGDPGVTPELAVRFSGLRLRVAPRDMAAGEVILRVRISSPRTRQLVLLRTRKWNRALRVRGGRIALSGASHRILVGNRGSRSVRITLRPGRYLLFGNPPGRLSRRTRVVHLRGPAVARLAVLRRPVAQVAPAAPVVPTAPDTSPPAQPLPPPTPRSLFTTICGGCHTLADAGTTGTVGPNLDHEGGDAEKVAKTIRRGDGAMPSFAGSLTEEQILQIATYVAAVVRYSD